jgi:hypothetical protein
MRSNRNLLIIYLLLLSAHIGLIWSLPYIPTQDGPSHIYNLAILRDLMHGGKIWGDYFTYNLSLVPNLGFHIFAYPLLSFLDPWQAEKAFLSLYIILMGLCVPFYLRTFDRPIFPASFFLFLVVFNFPLLMGFYSFCIAIPFFIAGFSVTWTIRNKSLFWKILAYNSIGLFLYCLHFIPFVFYLIAIFSTLPAELFKTGKKGGYLLKNIISIAPLLFLLSFYLASNMEREIHGLGYLIGIHRLAELLFDLFTFSSVNSFTSLHIFSVVFAAIFMALLCMSIHTALVKMGCEHITQKPYFLTAFLLILIYFLAPFDFGRGSFFNQRLPWVIFLVAFPLLIIPKNNFFIRYGSTIISSFAILAFLFNAVLIYKQATFVNNYMSGAHLSIPRGTLLMNYGKSISQASRIDFLIHAVSHYALLNGAVNVGNYEARTIFFLVRFKDKFFHIPPLNLIEVSPAEIDWSQYPEIKYLISWNLKEKERNAIAPFFQQVFENIDLTIFRTTQLEEN